MIPLADMLNHDPIPKVKWFYDSSDDLFKMQSKVSITSGEAITDSYGGKCNSEYLMYYGFSLKDNPKNNTLAVNIQHKNDSDLQLRIAIYPNFIGKLKADIDSIIFKDMLTFFRVATADNKTLNSQSSRSNYSKPLSIKNEIMVMYILKNYIDAMLERYGRSYADSVKELEKIKKLNNKRNALILIIGEMEILMYYKKFADEVIQYLKGTRTNLSSEYSSYLMPLKSLRRMESGQSE